MGIRALKLVEDSLHVWTLYGPVDQALKTSCQCDQVRFVPVHVPDYHGSPLELEIWCSATVDEESEDSFNMVAHAIFCRQAMQNLDMEVHELHDKEGAQRLLDHLDEEFPAVRGTAILVGAGATDLPDYEEVWCLIPELFLMTH